MTIGKNPQNYTYFCQSSIFFRGYDAVIPACLRGFAARENILLYSREILTEPDDCPSSRGIPSVLIIVKIF
jgi:hypothetical protein